MNTLYSRDPSENWSMENQLKYMITKNFLGFVDWSKPKKKTLL